MAEHPAGWSFADLFAAETEAIVQAREAADHFGVQAVSPAVGAQLAIVAALHPARSIIEVGTGTGVSGLWLLRGAPEAQLTTIDAEAEHTQVARGILTAAGYPAKQLRLITGRAADVLPRMNEGDYDLVLLDADAEQVAQHVDRALELVRPGGVVLVPHVLQGGKVANPVKRDRLTVVHRELLKGLRERPGVLAGISPVGDGLLQVVRR